MYSLSDQQIDFILDDLSNRGITIESLRQSLLDHVCILIEEHLPEKGDFEAFYSAVIKDFYKQELREIEEETVFLLYSKNRLQLSRGWFFVILFTIFLGPYIAYDIVAWIETARAGTWLDLPLEAWTGSLIFALGPLLTFLVLLLTPERWDPLIPKNSKVLIGINPFISILPAGATELRIEAAR